jgi:hypothetical protein
MNLSVSNGGRGGGQVAAVDAHHRQFVSLSVAVRRIKEPSTAINHRPHKPCSHRQLCTIYKKYIHRQWMLAGKVGGR